MNYYKQYRNRIESQYNGKLKRSKPKIDIVLIIAIAVIAFTVLTLAWSAFGGEYEKIGKQIQAEQAKLDSLEKAMNSAINQAKSDYEKQIADYTKSLAELKARVRFPYVKPMDELVSYICGPPDSKYCIEVLENGGIGITIYYIKDNPVIYSDWMNMQEYSRSQIPVQVYLTPKEVQDLVNWLKIMGAVK